MRASVLSSGTCRKLLHAACALAWGLFVLLSSSDASAYTWMVRHNYTGCGACHLDVSGGGVLTGYGRALGGAVLSTDYADSTGEISPVGGPFFGLVELPEPLLIGGDLRTLYYSNKVEGAAASNDFFVMQADFQAAVSIAHFMASASIGYAETGAFAAAITRAPEKNLVSRYYWAGYQFHEESALTARVGRMNLPFGIRNIEHTLWARALTQTSINADQQFGVSLAWSPGPFRAELMGILGNFQIHPDEYRERGYSGFVEWFPIERLGIGVSSLITHREVDPEYLKETWRQAHGLTVRWATPWEPLVLLSEFDYSLRSPKQDERREGLVGYLQADLEAVQGLHLIVTGETNNVGIDGTPFSWGLWFSQLWFLAPHFDVRLDSIYQSLGDEFGRTDAMTFLVQGHFYL